MLNRMAIILLGCYSYYTYFNIDNSKPNTYKRYFKTLQFNILSLTLYFLIYCVNITRCQLTSVLLFTIFNVTTFLYYRIYKHKTFGFKLILY